jgi:hypothetical protein
LSPESELVTVCGPRGVAQILIGKNKTIMCDSWFALCIIVCHAEKIG